MNRISLCCSLSLLPLHISLLSWLLVRPICEALTEWFAELTLHCGPNQCERRDVDALGQGRNLPDSCIPLQRAQYSDRLCSFIPLANQQPCPCGTQRCRRTHMDSIQTKGF